MSARKHHWTRRGVAIATLAGALAACGQSESPASLVAQAKQFQAAGAHQAALIQLKNALERAPDDAEARYLLAQTYLETGDALSAEKEIRRAIALRHPAELCRPVLVRTLMMAGRFQAVLDETTAAPLTAALGVLRGEAQLSLGQTAAAEQSFDAVLAGEPDNADALTGLARRAALRQDWAGAARLLERALARAPANVASWSFKGDLLRAQQDRQGAMAAYRHAIALKPGHRSAHLDLALLLVGERQFDAADAELDAARQAGTPSYLVQYAVAKRNYAAERYPAAQEALLKVLQVAPEHMPSHLLAGAVQLKLGALEQAEKHLRKYLEGNGNDLYARKLLAMTLLAAGQPDAALAALAPGAELGATDAGWLQLGAEARLRLRQYDQAGALLRRAIAIEPARAALHAMLGASLRAEGKAAAGLAELQRAAALEPASLEAGTALLQALLEQKQFDQALASAAALRQHHPAAAALANLEGVAQLGKRDPARARASFERALSLQPGLFPAVASLAQLDLEAKQPEAAKRRYTELLKLDKGNLDAYNSLARIALQERRRDLAIGWLEQAHAARPQQVTPALALGEQYLAAGQATPAATLLRKLQVAHPAHAELLELLGRAQQAGAEHAAALETFNKLAAAEPKSALAQYRLATVQRQLHNDAVAEQHLRRAVALDPRYLPPYLAQTELAMGRGDYPLALATVAQVRKIEPANPVAALLEGDILMVQGKPAPALRAYERGLAAAGTPQMLLKVAKALRADGKGGLADQRVAQWRAAHPDEPLTALYVAEGNMNNKRYKLAIGQLEGALKQMPANVVALNNLAWAYRADQDARALPTAERAFALAGDNPMVLDTLGWILLEQGNVGRGLPLVRQALAQVPDSADMRYHLAVGLHKAGERQQARQELERLLASGKPFEQLDDARALLKQL